MDSFKVSGRIIDILQRRIYPALVHVKNGVIEAVVEQDSCDDVLLLPGFVDAHIHIESSMLVPSAFAQIAVTHGTVATVSDPHEIANVCGLEGVRYMIENGKTTPFKFHFGAPSCVPATGFETAGAKLSAADTEILLSSPDIYYLSEMMNFPGVLHGDPEVMAKIAAAHKLGKPVDGHAPGLTGEAARKYAEVGINTDHECFTLPEALHKLNCGMDILIREGSAAKNFAALHELIGTHPERVMFCSDDKHPDELVNGHINEVVKRALALGYDLFDVLRAACINPVLHYGLHVGLLRPGDPADFIVINNISELNVLSTYIDGRLVAQRGTSQLYFEQAPPINNFKATSMAPSDFALPSRLPTPYIRAILANEGQLVTDEIVVPGKMENGHLVADVDTDILKIAVLNRYTPNAKPAVGFIKNFGLKRGALASTVAHDSHNIICIGTNDASMSLAINAVIAHQGGIAACDNDGSIACMPLPIGGLMTNTGAHTAAAQYQLVDAKAKSLGTPLHAPFMTLSFMALLVIPSLKMSDLGLFDGTTFQFTAGELASPYPQF